MRLRWIPWCRGLYTLCGFMLFVAMLSCEEKPSSVVRIGLNTWPGYEYLHLAEEKGFFEEEGLEIELVELNDLAQVRIAYERGQIDGMASTLVEVLQIMDRNPEVQPHIVLITDFSNGGDVIIARPEISELGQLNGQKIGVEAGSVSAYVLARALDHAGLTLDEVDLKWMSQHEMYQAMKTGQVDAVVTYPPISVKILREKIGHRLFDSSEIPGEILDVVTVNQSVLDSNPDFKSKLHRVWNKALEYAAQEPDQAHALMARRMRMSPQEVKNELQLVRMIKAEDQSPLKEGEKGLEDILEQVEQVMVKTGQLDETGHCRRVRY